MMRAIILAAGRGSRMGKQTEKKPKCLTMLNGKPLLEWQLQSLTNAGINLIELVTGYKTELLQQFVNNTYFNKDWAKTNMVSSLFCAPAFDGDTIVSYSDITYSHDHIIALKNSPHDIVITADIEWYKLWSLRFENPLDDAETFISDKDKLISIGEKTTDLSQIQAQFMGLLKISSVGWKNILMILDEISIEQKQKLDMTSLLGMLINNNVPVYIEFVKGKWCECDTYEDVVIYEREISNKMDWTHDWT